MYDRQNISISIDEYLKLPDTDLSKFHSRNSLEFLVCAYLTGDSEPETEPEQIRKNCELFRLALRAELDYPYKPKADIDLFAKNLPYTIAMTTKGAERDALMSILVKELQKSSDGELLLQSLDLEEIYFIADATPMSRTRRDLSQIDYESEKGRFALILKPTAEASADYELNTYQKLVELYNSELNSGEPFSRFIKECADNLELPPADDNRYLEAIATFIESTEPNSYVSHTVLGFVLDQVSCANHFFKERLSRFQILKLRHLYIEDLASELRSNDKDADFERDVDIEQTLGLEDISNKEILWITDVYLGKNLPSDVINPSDRLIALAAAHVIFLSSAADPPDHSADPCADEKPFDPLNKHVFDRLIPVELLEALGIEAAGDLREFRVAWGSEAFGALFKALHESWYSGGINQSSKISADFNRVILQIAFEDAVSPKDDLFQTKPSLSYLTKSIHAKPEPTWIASGIGRALNDYNLAPGELGPFGDNPLGIFAAIQSRLEDNMLVTTGRSQETAYEAQLKLIELISLGLKQKGFDITADQLKPWLRQEIVDGLGDFTALRGDYDYDIQILALAQKFSGVDILDLSEWESCSILSKFVTLPASQLRQVGFTFKEASAAIDSFCEILKLKAQKLGTEKSVRAVINLLCSNPYEFCADDFHRNNTIQKLLALAEKFEVTLKHDEALEAARRLTRFSFLATCDELDSAPLSSDGFVTVHIISLAMQLILISELSEPTTEIAKVLDEPKLIEELVSVNPSNPHHKKLVEKFLHYAKKSLTDLVAET
jgi:hypothetical protein